MEHSMKWFYRITDKIGVLGIITAALGCSACFPALGALAAALGLSFLSNFEGVFINKLLPFFAVIALAANLIGWQVHKNHLRGIISIIAPIGILAVMYPFWRYDWSTYLFYGCLVLMMVVSMWDLVKPPTKVCVIK